MRGYYRRRARFAHRGHSLNSIIWIIGLVVLFYTGHWWPGIMILVGISMLLSAAWRESELPSPAPTLEERTRSSPPPVITILPPASPAPESPTRAAPTALLPANCPRCGAPVRATEVKWTGANSAACAYCGSNLQAAKNKPA